MEESELSEKKFSILQEISNTIASSDNISLIANLIVDLAMNYTNSEKGSLMLLNGLGELSILSARGIDTELVMTYRPKIGEGISGLVAQKCQAMMVEDIERDERFKDQSRDRYKTKSFVSCPILSRNRLIGVLNINDKKDGKPFTKDEFSLIKIIADQAAIAIENASLMKALREKATDLEEINKKLTESDVLKTEFVMQVSHELRTPLNSINGATYYLRNYEEISKENQVEFYNVISEETTKLISLIDNLLNYLKLDDENRIITKAVVNLPDLLNELANSELLKTILRKKDLKLDIDIEKSISNIVADKARLNQFFLNLFESLSHELEPGDPIQMRVSENDYFKVILTLPRTMPESMLLYFSPGQHAFRSQKSDEELKLYLAFRIADLHRWEITTENADEHCMITLNIPKQEGEMIDAFVNTTVELFTEFVSNLLNINICSLMLTDRLTGDLTIRSARGLPEDVVKRTRIRLSEKISGWVAQEGTPLLVENIETDSRFRRISVPQYNTKSLLSVPLKIDGDVIGVMNLNNKRNAEPFTTRDLYTVSLLCERMSRIIRSLQAGEKVNYNYGHIKDSFMNLIEVEKKYNKKNTMFSELVFQIMRHLDAEEEDVKLALYVSLIYDLGLAAVDERILQKKEKLSSAEKRAIMLHPLNSVSLIKDFEFSDAAKKAIMHHHERYDGRGYPDKLSGEQIPFISRVLSVVDAFCAMVSERPYKTKLKRDEALREIESGAGSLYDPQIVEALESVVDLLPSKYFP
jgi:HD-GYP domain-containing protein (c-di-GMP phosphodiesterase class II)